MEYQLRQYLYTQPLRMKRVFLLSFTLSIVLIACHHSDKKANSLLNKNNLQAQIFTVTINKDTTLKTANGAFITIPGGALAGTTAATVQLEIKEAYSMEQIIMACLTTQSNGQPLSSGGMIYINAVGGQSVTLIKALSIKIPTASLDKKMQLFKGDTDDNGNINWVKPESLPHNPQLDSLAAGQLLFSNNCAACHSIGQDGTEPDLAHILTRTPDKKLLYDYTRNNREVMARGDVYYNCLYEKRCGTAMNLFPALSDEALDNLYSYIENTSTIRNLPVPNDLRPCIDSFMLYKKIKEKLEAQKDKLTSGKVKMVIEKIIPPEPSADTVGPPRKIAPGNNQSLYYQFNVEAFGWYNIDILLKDANSVESKLMIRIQGEFKTNINLYLIIPSAKVYEPGGLLENKDDLYGFYEKDGTIWLPQSLKAYILAIGEAGDKIIFDKKEFFTATNQQFDMNLSVISTASFNATIKSMDLSNLQFSAKDTKIAAELRKTVQELKDVEKIKPKNCSCDCGAEGWPVSDTSSKK